MAIKPDCCLLPFKKKIQYLIFQCFVVLKNFRCEVILLFEFKDCIYDKRQILMMFAIKTITRSCCAAIKNMEPAAGFIKPLA